MFMPYFFSEKSDRLTVVNGPGLNGSILIFLFFGVGAVLFCGGTLPPSVKLEASNIAGIAVSMGIAFCAPKCRGKSLKPDLTRFWDLIRSSHANDF